MEQPKAYSYIRFSHPSQRENDSLRRQTEASEKYAREHGLRIDTELKLRDLARSAYHGVHRKKGALGIFETLVKEGKIEKGSFLLIEDIDRLSREDPLDAFDLFRSIISAGITIVNLSNGMVFSKETLKENSGILHYLIGEMSRAHSESDRKSDRLTEAWKQKRTIIGKDVKFTSVCPEWLKPIRKQIGWEKFETIGFEPIKEAVDAINLVFDMKLAGYGCDKIAKELNMMQSLNGKPVWKPKGRNKKTPSWRGSYVSRLIHDNRKLLGEFQPYHYTGEESEVTGNPIREPAGEPILDYYPKVISEDKYFRIQELVKANARKSGRGGGRNDKVNNLFGLLAECNKCGYPMRFQNRGDGKASSQFLKCDKEFRKIDGGCEPKRIRYDLVEKAILTYCVGLSPSDVLQDSSQVESELLRLNNELQSIEGQISDNETKIERLLNAVEKTTNPDTHVLYNNRMKVHISSLKKLREQKEAIETEIKEKEQAENTAEAQIKGITELIDYLKDASDEDRYRLRLRLRSQLRLLIKKIWIGIDSQFITIFFNSGQRRVISIKSGIPTKKMDAFPKSMRG